MHSFHNQFKFTNIFRFVFLRILSYSLISLVDSLEWQVCCFLSVIRFLGWQIISFVLLSLRWIPLNDEFLASYLYVDSLDGEVSIHPPSTSTHPIIFLLTFQIQFSNHNTKLYKSSLILQKHLFYFIFFGERRL